MSANPKMIWTCVALLVTIIAVAALTGGYFLLFLIPCALMMGAMMWMMLGTGRGGGDRSS